MKVLYNDWPYGVDPNIVHLVVWTKFDLEDDPIADDLTPAAREKIDQFVEEAFGKQVPTENVGTCVLLLQASRIRAALTRPTGDMVPQLALVEERACC